MKPQVVKTRLAEVWMGEDGIMRFIYVLRGAELELQDAIESEAALAAITGGSPAPILVDIRKLKSSTRASRMHVRRPEFTRLFCAGAMLIDSPLTEMIGNLFIKAYVPPFPARLFRSEEEALAWLAGFVENRSRQSV